jgi:undecaprenyl-diphosphatase
MQTIDAIILAIIEGLTEFLPVSSTGHMIIASSVMGIVHDDFTKFFTVSIQFGAILSVLILYWRRFIQTPMFYLKLIVAFLPAALLGFLLNDFIDKLLENVVSVAFFLLAGGIVLLFVDRWFISNENQGSNEISILQALKIGIFQCLAMLPGVSRSAATIIGGLSQKLNRRTAAEFSFFLAVPTMFAATVFKMYKFMEEGAGFQADQAHLLLVGNVVAFFVGVLAIRFFIEFLTQRGFKLFGYYRIVLGIIILILHFMGVPLEIV